MRDGKQVNMKKSIIKNYYFSVRNRKKGEYKKKNRLKNLFLEKKYQKYKYYS